MFLDQIISGSTFDNKFSIESRCMTYGELAETSLSLAGGLDRIGLRKGEVVAFVLPNGVEFLISFLAITHLGGIALLLNPAYERAELEMYARQSGATTFIAADSCAVKCRDVLDSLRPEIGSARLIACSTDTVADHTLDKLTSGRPPSNSSRQAPDDTAVYFHSSGSTGSPKLIPKTFAQLAAEAESLCTSATITSDDVILCAVPLFHAFGFGNCLLPALKASARLVMPPPGLPLPMGSAELLNVIAHEQATVFPGVPFLFDSLLRSRRSADLSSVRLCFSAGSALPKEVFDGFIQQFHLPLRQLYGSSEAGAVTLNLDDDVQANWDSVGQPLRGVEITIDAADASGIGQIKVHSDALTCGYLGLPEQNATAFRDGVFCTEDTGRLDKAGRLYITGRRSRFVEIAGNKVDPREVEGVLLQHPGISEVVVLGIPAPRGHGERLKAVVVSNASISTQDLQLYCRERLASFKVPEVIEYRNEIPRNPMGKALRESLLGVKPKK